MTRKLKKSNGRPTIYNEDTVEKIESILKIGGSIIEACAYANVARDTYYTWLATKEGFSTRMEQAKIYSDIIAKNIVIDSLHKEKDLGTAKWWLEKRQFKNDTQLNIGEQKVLVIPGELIKKYKIDIEDKYEKK